MTKRLKKLLVAITIGVVLITAGIISGVCVINASLAKRPTYVSTAEEFETAINDDVDKPIVLNNDIVVHGDLNANKLFDLEMNGHDLRVIGKMTLRTSKAGEMYLCDGKTAIKSREKVQADSVEIDAVNATVTWNANVQLKDGYTADDFVVAAADHSFIFNGIMLGAGGQATKTAMTVKQGRVVVAVKDEDVNAPAEIVVPAGANGVLVDNKTDDEVNIKTSTSVSVSGNVSIDVDENAEDVKISAKTDSSKVTIKSGTVSSVDASGSEVIVDKGAVVDGKITAGKVENNGTVGEIEAGEIVDNSVAIYKEDKKNELDEYALAKGKDSYTSDNWTAVQLAVTAGKKAIDDAADIAAVDVAFATAKAEIDKVKTAEQEAADALANKKTETLAALEAYAESKGEANYTAENWTAIQSAVTAGKKAIDKAADIAAVDAAFAEAKTAIDAIETVADSLEAYKTTQKAALEAYAESKGEANYTAENWTAIQSAVTAGKEAIAAAANETAVDAAYNAAAANIDAVKTIAQQLADKKAEVIGKLDEAKARYAEADYRAAQWKNITDAYDNAKNGINAVTVITALPGNFVATFTATASAQKTNAQLTAEELAAKKAEVAQSLKAAYDGIDLTLYRETEKNAITAKYEEYKAAVNAVTDIANLPGTFVTDFNAFVATQKTNAQLTAEELAAKKAEVIGKLDEAKARYAEADYRAAQWKNITDAYDNAKNGINAVTVITALPGNFVATFTATASAQKTNAQLTAEELAAKKAEVAQSLKDAYDGIDLTLYRETEKNAITAKYEEYKAAVNAVTDIANLPGTFVTDFNAFVATQKTNAQLTAEELAAKKAEVIGKLDEAKARYAEADYRAAQWKNITDAYDNAKNGINAVTDIAQLPGNFVSNFTTVAAAQPTAADLDEQELAAKKTEANQALENHYNSKKKSDYSDTDWDNITKFYNSGSETINSAETIAQVEESLASAIAKMDEIKRSYLLAPEYNGGSGAQGESMRIYDDGKTYSLSEPEKENYVFMGWYTSSDFTEDTKVTHVTYESGIKKIYAKWGVMVDVQLPGVDTGYAVEPGKVFGDVFTDVDNFAGMMGMGVPYGYYYVDTTGDIHKVESTDVNNFTEPVMVYAVFKVDNALYMYSGDMGDNHTLMVIGAVEVNGALTIKESIEYCDVAMPVTAIAKNAFADVDIKTVYIPESVDKIGASIFKAGSTVTVYTDRTADWKDTSWKNGATVTVITKAYYVASAEEFRAAVSADAKYIRLTSDIASVGSDVQILVGAYNENREIEIDLNGKILGYRLCPSTTPDDKTDSGYRLKMTVKNGQIGTNNGKNESNVNLYYGFNLQGNGIDLVLNNVKAISYYGGLYANGRWNGNTINATGCEFLAVGVYQSNGDGGTNGAYLPGKNTYNFINCTFAGEVGVYVKSGDTVFTNCTIKSTCDKYLVPLYNGNGSDGYGSALIIDSTKGYQTPMTVKVIGGTVTSISGYAVEEVSNAKTEAEKICYSATTISSTTVLSGKLGRVYSENGTVTVEDENGVKAAYASTAVGVAKAMAKGGTIVLTKDLIGSGEGDSNTCIGVRAADGDVEIVLDLNGKRLGYELNLMTTIAGSGDDSGYRLKIKIINGKIGTDDGYSAADADGKRGQLYYGVLCQGNGVDLTLENVESSAYYGGLYANGQYKNNVITANNCVFKAACDNGLDGSGAYLPGQNTYKFTKCEFSGSVGVYIKSGNTTFTDCTITTNGTYVAPTYNGNGADGSGSALIIDSTKGYQTPMTVKIIGGTVTSISGYAVEEVSNAKTEAEKICYSTTTISSTTVLSGKLGNVQSENGTVTIVA